MFDTQQVVWLVTGANRGIGLEIVRQLIASPSNIVIATSRDPSRASALKTLAESLTGRVHVVALDLNDRQSVQESVEAVASIVGDKGVDYLINNAGVNIGGDDKAFTMDLDVMKKVYETNVVGIAHVSQAYLPLVEKSTQKTIVNMSSILGSLGTEIGAIHASYSITKAGVNMLTYKQSRARPDLIVVSMWPGHLKTDMGGPDAPTELSEGVEGTLKVIKSLAPKDSGKFLTYLATELPW